MLAKKVIDHLELSGFTIDESAQVMTKRRPTHGQAASIARPCPDLSMPPWLDAAGPPCV
jgi:hypothetical protein